MSDLGITFKDSIIAPDKPPVDEPVPSSYEYACEACGKELFYGGRGRHPRFCDEHKGSGSTGSRKASTKPNEALAKQAAAVLSQLNSMCALGLVLPYVPVLGENPLYLPQTAGALAKADEGFQEMAYNALITDPKLCRMILKAGGAGGKIALIMAYGALGAAIMPVAIEEMRNKRRDESRSEVA